MLPLITAAVILAAAMVRNSLHEGEGSSPATAAGEQQSKPESLDRSSNPEFPELSQLRNKVEMLLNKSQWSEADWDLIEIYLNTEQDEARRDAISQEEVRRMMEERARLVRQANRRNAPDTAPVDDTRARTLMEAIRNGTSGERAQAADRLADHKLSKTQIGELAALYRTTESGEVRAAVIEALRGSPLEEYSQLLLSSLLSKSGQEHKSALFVIATLSEYQRTFPDEILTALEKSRSSGLSVSSVDWLYSALGNLVEAEEKIEEWLVHDALDGPSYRVQSQALKHIPSENNDLPRVLDSLRSHESDQVRNQVLLRASELVISKHNMEALGTVIHFLAKGSSVEQQRKALDAVKWVVRLRPVAKIPAEKEDAVRAKLALFLSTKPPKDLEEDARSLIEQLSESR